MAEFVYNKYSRIVHRPELEAQLDYLAWIAGCVDRVELVQRVKVGEWYGTHLQAKVSSALWLMGEDDTIDRLI
jgi:hypothetical protein